MKFTDLSDSLKILIQTEKIKEIIIKKGLGKYENFVFHKKVLRYDSGLRTHKSKNLFKNIEKSNIPNEGNKSIKEKKNEKNNQSKKTEKNSSLIIFSIEDK